ncbi:MAG: hypothetical protein K2K80_01295 [Clostridia bacterium]|nr:hypothetical protein [Clostridia bacterium]
MRTIVDLEGKEWRYDDCLSCAINSGKVKPFGGIIYETANFVVTQDFSRPIIGFLVISAKRHVVTYDNLTEEERADLAELAYKTQTVLKNLKICDYFNIYVAEYKEGHFHLQILPRYKYMEDEHGTIIGNLNRGFKYAKDNLSLPENLIKINEALQKISQEMKRL